MDLKGGFGLKDGSVKIKRALISVSNKSKLLDLVNVLSKRKIEIISTGGTSRFLIKNGYEAKGVSDLTGFPEILNGRVKTLHPGIHAPILFDRQDAGSVKEIKKRYKLTTQELADVAKAIKEVGNQLGDIDDAIAGKQRKGRKKK